MRFLRTSRTDRSSAGTRDVCYLSWNTWDDFSYKTTFDVTVYDDSGDEHRLGQTRIIFRGQTPGIHDFPVPPAGLGEEFCSLGDNRSYYLQVRELPPATRSAFLTGMRDCVSDPQRFLTFQTEPAMQISLLRSVAREDVLVNFPRVLAGLVELTPYTFSYIFEAAQSDAEQPEAVPIQPQDGTEPVGLRFAVRPNSKPPSNVHVLIGRNGVGKTRILAGMADALTDNRAASFGLRGSFSFEPQQGSLTGGGFLNLVIISFSAFDRFDPIAGGSARTEKAVPFYYVGIKHVVIGEDGQPTETVGVKSTDDLNVDFKEALITICQDESRVARWVGAVEALSSDPGIRDLDVERLRHDPDGAARDEIIEQVAWMSSGHKIVLLTITRLVENVSDRSLVLLDEPETHLHPPLLGSFMRVLSDLLVQSNGVGIVATHSPVVLQEVPATCVWQLMPSGRGVRPKRPDIETFAENVSVLTRKVFGLEAEQSGFYALLTAAAEGADYDTVDSAFMGRIGAEGRALLRALTWKPE